MEMKMAQKNAQDYAVLDICLAAMAKNGVISSTKLKKGWNSIKELISVKRLKYFLVSKGIKLHWKCIFFLREVEKAMAKRIPKDVFTAVPRSVTANVFRV
jgi:hypothetical protein